MRLTEKHLPLLRFFILLMLSYGLLYYAIKAYVPAVMGGTDFERYLNIYIQPLDLKAARSPFVMRQLSAVLTHWVHSLGITYSPKSLAESLGADRQVLISAIIANYLGLLSAAWITGSTIEHLMGRRALLVPLLGGVTCLLAFHTMTSVLTGLTEGVSWLIFAAGLHFYMRRRLWPLLLVFAAAVFQRETILVIFGVFAAVQIALERDGRRFNAMVLAGAIAAFAAYVLVRKLYAAPGYEVQFMPTLTRIVRRIPTWRNFVFQGLFSNNLLLLYLALLALAGAADRFCRRWAVMLIVAWVALVAMGFLAGIGNNMGRISSILSPAFAVFIALFLARLDGMRQAVADG